MLCRVPGSDIRSLSKETRCLGVSLPTEPSDSLNRGVPVRMPGTFPPAGGVSMEVRDAESSRRAPRKRPRIGEDWTGSAVSLSELVKFDDED